MTETTKRHKRLFARLLVEEHNSRVYFRDSEGNKLGTRFGGMSLIHTGYLSFLKSQRNTRNEWCPYNLATRAILQQS